ncbi:MAG: hypothetical protein HWE23_08370 [Rhodobacteraceae bacterium]|nr:hypothetical protein [Paracoccaceae bacterium]
MIIAAMYVALGFFTATLLALAVVPLIYKRTVRLTIEAMRATNPSNYFEVRAAHDIERARNALIVNKAERALQLEQEAATARRARVGELQKKVEDTRAEYEEKLSSLKHALDSAKKERKLAEKQAEKRGARNAPSTKDVKQIKAEIASLQKERDAAVEQIEAFKRQAAENEEWQPTEDAMSLAIIASLESQLIALQQKVAQFESGDLLPATSIEGLEKQDVSSVISRLEQDLSELEQQYVIAQSEVARLSALQGMSDEGDEEEKKAALQTVAEERKKQAQLELKLKSRDRALQRSTLQIAKLRSDLEASTQLKSLREDLLKVTEYFEGGTTPGETSATNSKLSSSADQQPSSQAPEEATPAANGKDSGPTAVLVNRILKANKSAATKIEAGSAETETQPGDTQKPTSQERSKVGAA